ncbi:cytochrome b5-like heme/steroid binding domain-containing protein [Xylaria intraflava]|nr:cytochrome b5-like heme/steroid binding domain-containing protein [Xylaria intraflava]
MPQEKPVYTLQQVSEHRSLDDLWITIRGKVYDVSGYLEEHPGGKDVLLQVSGTDATEDFDFVDHSDDAKDTLSGLEIGRLAGYVHKPSDKEAKALASARYTVGKSNGGSNGWTQSSKFAIAVAAVLAGAGVLATIWNSRLGGLISSNIPLRAIDGFFSGAITALVLGGCAGGAVLQRMRHELFHHKDVFQHVPYFDFKDEIS